MTELPNNSVDLVVTSPPYFNIKDYSKNGYQIEQHSVVEKKDIGNINNYENYIAELLKVWRECERVLKPNAKLIINTPLMPMKKSELNTHENRHIFNIDCDIQHSILKNLKNLFLMDVYIWNRINSAKTLMFGSYPYPANFYAQNTSEFITVYVKNGKSQGKIPFEIKEKSRLTREEWVNFTQQIWDIPIPNKSDVAFGKHPALMPEEIPYRCIRLFTFENDIVLDPFAGSGTTLKIAKELNRNFVGYEIYENYKNVIETKLNCITKDIFSTEIEKQKSLITNLFSYFIDESLNGTIEYELEKERILITEMEVSQKRKKIGTNLMNQLIEFAAEKKVQFIDIYALPTKEMLYFLLKYDFKAEFEYDKDSIIEILTSDSASDFVHSKNVVSSRIFLTKTLNGKI